MSAKIYYLRSNATEAQPTNVLFLDVETRGVPIGGEEIHKMYIGWTWRVTLDKRAAIVRDQWREWTSSETLYDYITTHTRPKSPLYIIGSNITFDLFASGLAERLHMDGWTASMVYDKGLVTIICLEREECRLKILAMQNFLSGSVEEWGNLLNLPKLEINLVSDDVESVSTYCRRDVEITGRIFLDYLGFVVSHNLGGFAYTCAGQSLRAYRHNFMKYKILHYDQYGYNQFVRSAYTGGRVECGFIGKPDGEPFVKLDINSMYPHVMREYTYPTKIRQWVNKPTLKYTRSSLEKYLCIAEVELDTNEPAFPLRVDGKLLFPTGSFTTHLCTESLRYALSIGAVQRVVSLMTFEGADLFSDFVDYFYTLRRQYKEEGNAVYEQSVKLILNSLYGKFGEKRETEIKREPDTELNYYRRPCIVPIEKVRDEEREIDWHYKGEKDDLVEHVQGTETSAFGMYWLTAGEREGPHSHPAIAAHVTDYARCLLYRFMQLVGLDRVLYCDTDSMIIRERDLERVESKLSESKLGLLKVEGRAQEIELRGPKDYSFGDERRTKGIRANAQQIDTDTFEQVYFPSLFGLVRNGRLDGYPIGTIRKTLSRTYGKGNVSTSGRVHPYRLSG